MEQEYIERIYHPKLEYYREVFKDSPRWSGSDSLEGKTIIVYFEQGFGDIIQFARYVSHIKRYENCRVVAYCPKDLHRLFLQGLQGVDAVLDKDDPELPPHDYHVLSMSLPFALGLIEVDVPYLTVGEKEDVNDLLPYYKIGIAWEGNPNHSNNDVRSCPLGLYRRIFADPRIQCISLQKKMYRADLVQGCEDFHLLTASLNDFYDTAKLINAVDLVITVDTSVLHLAGAMGKRTIGLLSYSKDPRWEVGVNWYPSVQLIAQTAENDWSTVEPELVNSVREIISRSIDPAHKLKMSGGLSAR